MDPLDPLTGSTPVWASALVVLADVVLRLVALGVVPHNRRPAAAWGWLLAIFFVPVIGVLLYIVIGRSNLPPPRRRTQLAIGALATANAPARAPGQLAGVPPWASEVVRLNQDLRGMPLVAGNRLHILADYDESIDAIAAAVRAARRSVHMEYYILASDSTSEPVLRALVDAHERGVEVRVLIDFLGSRMFPGHREAVERLQRGGVPLRHALPVRPWRLQYQRADLRNHRKIVVVDGEVAFTGSQNMIAASYDKKQNLRDHVQWRDLMLRVEGPIVAQLQAVFLGDWYSESSDPLPSAVRHPSPVAQSTDATGVLCQVLPSGPGADDESNLRMFNSLFYSARHRIVICTPYFVPEESMLMAITTAARRGVHVSLYVGRTADHAVTHHAQRSFYEMLMRAGVHIHLYERPYILHSKFLLIDEDVAVVASSNMDIRSLVLNLEVNLLVCDRGFVSRMHDVVAGYARASSVLDLDEWMSRSLSQKYLDNVCRLTSGLQ